MLVALSTLLLSACTVESQQSANDDIPDGPRIETGSSDARSVASASVTNSGEPAGTGEGGEQADLRAYHAWLKAQGIDTSASSNEYEDFQRWKEWRAARQPIGAD